MTRTHRAKIAQWIGAGKIGTEVGPGEAPVPGLDPRPIYVDCYKEFGAAKCVADYYGHACALPFHANSLDYVISSHVLEHVANPVAALEEWYRVLRPGGIVYLLVPDRRVTWDHGRPLTPVEHMLADYEAGTTPADATHIDDFVQNVDWARWCPSIPPEDVPAKKIEVAQILHDTVARGEAINLHFHTFEPENLLGLLRALQKWPKRRFAWEILDHDDGFPATNPDGIFVALRVLKGWRDRAEAEWFSRRTGDDPAAVVRDDAEPFAEFARKTTGTGGVR
jgi:SAM-dependent methyltransferase